MTDVVSDIDSAIGIIGNAGLDAGEAAVIAAFPWLGFPVIKQIWEAILSRFALAALAEVEASSTRVLYPLIDQMQANAARAIALKLQKDLDDARASKTTLQGELDDLKEKYANLIHLQHPS